MATTIRTRKARESVAKQGHTRGEARLLVDRMPLPFTLFVVVVVLLTSTAEDSLPLQVYCPFGEISNFDSGGTNTDSHLAQREKKERNAKGGREVTPTHAVNGVVLFVDQRVLNEKKSLLASYRHDEFRCHSFFRLVLAALGGELTRTLVAIPMLVRR